VSLVYYFKGGTTYAELKNMPLDELQNLIEEANNIENKRVKN
jgi:hypothetical protein